MSTPEFKAGDRVVCVDDAFDPIMGEFAMHLPLLGFAYTIRAVGERVGPPAVGKQGTGYVVEEIWNAATVDGEVFWDGRHFKLASDLANLRDRAHLSSFKKFLDAGRSFDDLPEDIRRWWMNRY